MSGHKGGFNKKKGGPRRGKEWTPLTKLGRLVAAGHIKTIDQVFHFALPIKEHQIVDKLVPGIKDELIKIMPVQKQTSAGQRTRFKAFVIVGDKNGHVGFGSKCAKETTLAIRGATDNAKTNLIPVKLGYWGPVFGKPHTVPTKVTGKCGSVRMRLIPAPQGTGLVASPVPKKILAFAGVKDVYTSSRGSTRTVGNVLGATYNALSKTSTFLSPDTWAENSYQMSPMQMYALSNE
ncbi:MAG: 40S ribosomal protein S2-3 [Cercozoa sp. M6MM]